MVNNNANTTFNYRGLFSDLNKTNENDEKTASIISIHKNVTSNYFPCEKSISSATLPLSSTSSTLALSSMSGKVSQNANSISSNSEAIVPYFSDKFVDVSKAAAEIEINKLNAIVKSNKRDETIEKLNYILKLDPSIECIMKVIKAIPTIYECPSIHDVFCNLAKSRGDKEMARFLQINGFSSNNLEELSPSVFLFTGPEFLKQFKFMCYLDCDTAIRCALKNCPDIDTFWKNRERIASYFKSGAQVNCFIDDKTHLSFLVDTFLCKSNYESIYEIVCWFISQGGKSEETDNIIFVTLFLHCISASKLEFADFLLEKIDSNKKEEFLNKSLKRAIQFHYALPVIKYLIGKGKKNGSKQIYDLLIMTKVQFFYSDQITLFANMCELNHMLNDKYIYESIKEVKESSSSSQLSSEPVSYSFSFPIFIMIWFCKFRPTFDFPNDFSYLIQKWLPTASLAEIKEVAWLNEILDKNEGVFLCMELDKFFSSNLKFSSDEIINIENKILLLADVFNYPREKLQEQYKLL